MPIYEYQCKQCGHVTAALQRAGSSENPLCESCGSEETAKIFSTFAVDRSASSSSGGSSCPTGTCPLS